jgi:hypothetical protein
MINFIKRFYHQIICGWIGVSWKQKDIIEKIINETEGVSAITDGEKNILKRELSNLL